MAEVTLASAEIVSLPGEAYRGVRQRFYALVLELCQKPISAATLASEFSSFYRSLGDDDRFELSVIEENGRLCIFLKLQHAQREHSDSLAVGQKMSIIGPTQLGASRWQMLIKIPIGPSKSLNREDCQAILDQRSREELTHEVSSTTQVLSRVQEELNIAADIQRSFLISPHGLDRFSDDLDLGAIMSPSKEIGGDLYDCISLGAQRYLLCVGDVSGKGVPASLTMSTCLTLIRSYSEVIDSPSAIMRRINQRLCTNNSGCAFTTLFLALLNTRSQELRYCNAGHNPALLIRESGLIERLKTVHGPALGIVEDAAYGDTRVSFSHSETLLAYSDGASEMFNPNNQRIGLAGMEGILASISACSSQQLVDQIMQSLLTFASSEPQHDDITLLAASLPNPDASAHKEELSISMPNHLDALVTVKQQISQFAASHQLERSLLRKVQVAADEILGNVIRYGCSDLSEQTKIEVRLQLTNTTLSLWISDPGFPFNPIETATPDLTQPLDTRPIGGLGLHLVKQLTHSIEYERNSDRNILKLTFAI